MNRRRTSLGAVLALLLLPAVVGFAIAPDPAFASRRPGAPKSSKAKKADAKKDEDSGSKKDKEKPFDKVVKDMEKVEGLFTFYVDEEEGKILMEILPDQLDKTFLFAGSVDKATGERGNYASMMGAEFPFQFHKNRKNVQWVIKNSTFIADEGTPSRRAVDRSFPDAILGAAKIKSKPHPERKSILIDTADLLHKDLPGLSGGLGRAYRGNNYRYDKTNSGVREVKAFPENVLFSVDLHFTSSSARGYSLTLPDIRSIPMRLTYEFANLPDNDYRPRRADDRVGHFQVMFQDFTSDHDASPYTRYIARWDLQKADPDEALSIPKEPIVYYLENTIPEEYREWIKEGTLMWNKAFARIGFKDAVVVKQQPDDAEWDAGDTRYTTIRWFAGVDATFAIGPSTVHPYTGQILNADIGISEGIVRYSRRYAQEFVTPLSQESEMTALDFWSHTAWARFMNERTMCSYGEGLTQQAAFGMSVLSARGMMTPAVEKEMVKQYVIELTAHEVGHTLGLRHNFRASSILDPDELLDTEKTKEFSQAASVMDYNPVVIATESQKQGDFLPTSLGPYDYWAIEYAYKLLDEIDEESELNRIAAKGSNDPMLPYSTDEDANGTFSARSIDPLANQYDQSSDPLGYFGDRIQLVHELWAKMEKNLVKEGEGYQVLRRTMNRGLWEIYRSSVVSSKFIGGIHHRRAHVGDPGNVLPYTPVASAKQREALDFIKTNVFGEESFKISPDLHNKLAIDRMSPLNWPSYYGATRLDYPWHAQVLNIQRGVLNRLYDPITLSRIQDSELRFNDGETPFLMADLFSGLEDAIWSELDGNNAIYSVRRNLQREHLRNLIRLTLRKRGGEGLPRWLHAMGAGGGPGPLPPEDASTLARASLQRLRGKIRRAIASGALGGTTRAHLDETLARIEATLDAQIKRDIG